jgi:hypothetical protein
MLLSDPLHHVFTGVYPQDTLFHDDNIYGINACDYQPRMNPIPRPD